MLALEASSAGRDADAPAAADEVAGDAVAGDGVEVVGSAVDAKALLVENWMPP